jgi:hypothetical protein
MSLVCRCQFSRFQRRYSYKTDGDVDDSDSEEDKPPKKQKPVVKLEVGEDDRPMLPDSVMDASMIFDDLHPIIREYMTLNYSFVRLFPQKWPSMLKIL